MKNRLTKYLTIAAMAFFLCGKAMAGGTASLGYSHYDLSDGVELGAVYGSVGYQLPVGKVVSFTPEVRLGNGVKNDSFFLGTVKMGRLYGFAGRLSFHAADRVELFASVSYINYELKFRSFSDSGWEPGFGAGAGFGLTDHLGLELIYENVDSSNVASAALRFRF